MLVLKKLLKNDIVKGSLFALILKILAALGTFFLNILLARALGPEEAGYFFLAQAVVFILAAICRQGFDNAMVRLIAGYYISGEKNNISQLYGYVLLRIIPVLLFMTTIMLVYSDEICLLLFNNNSISPLLVIGALMLLPLSLSQFNGFCLQGLKKVPEAMFFQNAALTIITSIAFYFIVPATATEAIKIYFIVSLFICILSFYSWFRNDLTISFKFNSVERLNASKVASSLFLILLFGQLTQWIGQLMLGVWSEASEVAIFATAQRTALLASFFLIALNAIAAPKYAEAHKKGKDNEIKKIAVMSSRFLMIAAFFILFFILFFAEWLMSLFGPEFVSGANILRILAIGQFVNLITGSVGYLLQMTGNEKKLRNNVFFSSAVLFFGGPVFIPLYGVYGAAVITALSVATQNVLSVYQVKKQLGFNTLNIFQKI
ncbi:oligosaccharide flippase family protein [Photobacterium sp. DNB23_23_1]